MLMYMCIFMCAGMCFDVCAYVCLCRPEGNLWKFHTSFYHIHPITKIFPDISPILYAPNFGSSFSPIMTSESNLYVGRVCSSTGVWLIHQWEYS